jgi:large subunit ribosomal protein L9
MKVVLLKDVKNIGRAGTVQDVSDGHAVNLLIPRKLAVLATAAATRRAESVAAQADAKRELDTKLIADRVASLAEERIVILKKANDQGHLYDGVDAKDIAEAAQLPEDAISLDRPIKMVGEHDIPVAFGENFGTVRIVIEAE